jgi:preprotein translocase subunit YajC
VEQFVSLLPIIGIALLFWLLIIRPASRRQKALSQLQSGLEPGNQVMMSAGIFGTVERIIDDRVQLRVADGVSLEVARGSINTVVPNEPVGGTGQDPA